MNKKAKVVQYEFKAAHTYAQLLQDFLDNAKNVDVVEAEEVYQLIDEAFKCAYDAVGTVKVLEGVCAKLVNQIEELKKRIAELEYYLPRQTDEIYESKYYCDDYCNRLFHPTCNKDAHY